MTNIPLRERCGLDDKNRRRQRVQIKGVAINGELYLIALRMIRIDTPATGTLDQLLRKEVANTINQTMNSLFSESKGGGKL